MTLLASILHNLNNIKFSFKIYIYYIKFWCPWKYGALGCRPLGPCSGPPLRQAMWQFITWLVMRWKQLSLIELIV